MSKYLINWIETRADDTCKQRFDLHTYQTATDATIAALTVLDQIAWSRAAERISFEIVPSK